MRFLLALGLFAGISFFYRLGSIGLFGPDESRYAEVAREMAESADWLTPRLMGYAWLDKPPLYYWAAAGSFRLLGETEFAARLPSALAALVTCWFVGRIGRHLFGPTAGFASQIILATSLGLIVYGRAAAMDSLLTLSLTLGLGIYVVQAIGRPSLLLLAASFAFFGGAALAKGPLGLALPLLILGAFHAFRDQSLLPRPSGAAVAAGSFLAVAVPWYACIYYAQGWEFVEVFLLEHNLDRLFTAVHRHPGPLYYYLPVLAVGLFPWSALLPLAVARSFGAIDPPRLFLLLWIALPTVVFSLAGSKLPGYIIPVLPPCSLLLGQLWSEAKKRDQAVSRSLVFHLLLALVLAGAALHGFSSRLEEVSSGGWLLALVTALVGAAGYLASQKSQQAVFWTLACGSSLLTLFLLHHTAPLLEPYQSLKQLTSAARPLLRPDERIVCYKDFYRQALFYTRGRLGEIWTLEEFEKRTRERGRLLTLAERRRYDELAGDPALSTRLLASSGRRVLAEARPAASSPAR